MFRFKPATIKHEGIVHSFERCLFALGKIIHWEDFMNLKTIINHSQIVVRSPFGVVVPLTCPPPKQVQEVRYATRH